MLKKSIITLVVLLGLLGAGLVLLCLPVVSQKEGVVYYLSPGKVKANVIKELAENHIITFPRLLSFYTSAQSSSQLKSGEYLFPVGSSTLSIWRQLINGKGLYYRSFTIVPGWTFNQLRRELLQTETLRHNTSDMDDKQIMVLVGRSGVSPEGQFFPETYLYTRGVPDLVILKRAFDLMQSRLSELWEKRLPGLPYRSPYEALIAASLIEKEAYLNAERPVIASVLVNRLRKNMLLQFDPTVIYGLGDRYTGKITKQDLVANTAYNTYLHRGLTPTPIAMPSLASLEAALHPAATDYLYFVARGDGAHQFSSNLADHNAAVTQARKQKMSYFNQRVFERYLPYTMLKVSTL